METLLNVQPSPQPQPTRNPAGDCFACALAAAMRHLFPDQPLSFDDAWECFTTRNSSGQPTTSNTWGHLRSAIFGAASRVGGRVDVLRDIVQPTFDLDHWSHAWWHWSPDETWAMRLEAWLRAGWVAFTEVDFYGRGPMTPDGYLRGIDHVVLLDGVRDRQEAIQAVPGASCRVWDVHVVCSVKGAYWTPVMPFLRLHGAAGWTLVRPRAE